LYQRVRKVVGGWRKLHNEVLHDLYASPHIDQIIEMDGTCSMHVRWKYLYNTGWKT